jgi:hypothetical protein
VYVASSSLRSECRSPYTPAVCLGLWASVFVREAHLNPMQEGDRAVCAVSDILSVAKRSQRAYGLITVQK